jgi:pyruvate dehydrogenase E2 component (dihydrolipoamide acetyltransferase)
MDVPAPFAGKVREVLVEVGDKVSQGTKLLEMETDDGGAPTGTEASAAASEGARDEGEAPDAVGSAAEAEQQAAPEADSGGAATPERKEQSAGEREDAPASERDEAPPAAGNGGGPVYASPSVRRIARELSIDLSKVTGTGRKGRITKEDVERGEQAPAPEPAAPSKGAPAGAPAFEGLPPWPQVDFASFGEVERVALTRIQKLSGPNLARNWVMIPHVTHHDEADITDLEAFRKETNERYAKEGVKLTMVALLVKACVASLKAFPVVNSSLDGDELVLKRYYNIGFAADTPQGLVVPVIKDADSKGILDVARELTSLSGAAREGKLKMDAMRGATFTISSLGGIGGTGFTPIVNAPEVAILGVTRSAMRPVWNGSEFVPRLMVPLSLSYDHRVIDGALAARFTAHLATVLTDLRRALL